MYSVAEKSENVTTIKIPYIVDLDQSFLLSSDRHWDNPASNQELQKEHLDEAIDRSAGVIDLGDTFCAMQGKFDKRASKDSIRPEHCNGDYLDSLVDTAVDWFSPYARSLIRISRGNHEQAIKKRHETDLIQRFVNGLNERNSTKIHSGGYTGWVRFVFENTKKKSQRETIINLWYIHGYGGGGPVTKGVIQTARRAAYLPDANIIATGHIHEEWNVTIPRARITAKGQPYQDEQIHVQVPTYKEEYGLGEGGYHIEEGRPPKPIGAVWLNFKTDKRGKIVFQTERAK